MDREHRADYGMEAGLCRVDPTTFGPVGGRKWEWGDTMMFGKEKNMSQELAGLKERYGLLGIKAEFEAEGSSFEDLVRLRRLTAALGIELHLKIGGVEAFRDIKDSLTLGVDGLVAPMVESPFGLLKFLECVDKIYPADSIRLAINIETRHGIEDIDDILSVGKGRIHGVTIGRTDLAASWMDPAVKPDTTFVMDLVRQATRQIAACGLEVTVGGSIQLTSLPLFAAFGSELSQIRALETRKVMLPSALMVSADGPQALKAALAFEHVYIESKKEIQEVMMRDENARLAKLAGRV